MDLHLVSIVTASVCFSEIRIGPCNNDEIHRRLDSIGSVAGIHTSLQLLKPAIVSLIPERRNRVGGVGDDKKVASRKLV